MGEGEKGGGGNCTGKSGADLLVPVPTGTMVYDAEQVKANIKAQYNIK